MQKAREISTLLLETVAYSFFGSVFVLIVLAVEDFLLTIPCDPNFSCDTSGRSIPVGGILIGAALSVTFWNLFFGRIIKSSFTKWFLILVTSSIAAILLQTIYLISASHMTIEQIISAYFWWERIYELLGVKLIIKLFLILTPFTIFFANRRLIIEKIEKQNALK